jgi:hypothetical protein
MSAAPSAPRRPCLYHPERAAQRRGLCWTCHTKFRRAGVPMPAMDAPGPRPWTPAEFLLAWVASLAPSTRAALHDATAPTSSSTSEAA